MYPPLIKIFPQAATLRAYSRVEECVYTVTPNLQNICYGRPDPEDCISKTVLLFKNLDWIIQRKSKVSGHPV